MRTFYVLSLLLVLASGCEKTGSVQDDMAALPDLSIAKAMPSRCGKPGDKGNALGVGKYCTKQQDCSDNSQAILCSTLGNDPTKPEDDTYFCVALCNKMSPPGFCGENAICECSGAGCGCTPTYCTSTPDGGMTSGDGGMTSGDGGMTGSDM